MGNGWAGAAVVTLYSISKVGKTPVNPDCSLTIGPSYRRGYRNSYYHIKRGSAAKVANTLLSS